MVSLERRSHPEPPPPGLPDDESAVPLALESLLRSLGMEIKSTAAVEGILLDSFEKLREALIIYGTARLDAANCAFLRAKLWEDTVGASKHMIPSTFEPDVVTEFIEERILAHVSPKVSSWTGYFENPEATAFTHCRIAITRLPDEPHRYVLRIEPSGDDSRDVERLLAKHVGAKRILETLRVTRCEI